MNNGWVYRDVVGPTVAGWTVLEFYARRYRHSSRGEWEERIAQGQILIDERPTTADTRLLEGQRLAYSRPPWSEPPAPLDFEIVYEDKDLLVVSKPAGLPVLPGAGFLDHTLLGQLQKHYPDETPLPIHRLGRGTSGLMLLARSSAARADLSAQMRKHQICKIYRALATGNEMPDHFTVTQPIGKVPYPGLGYLYAATPTGMAAESTCRVLRRGTESSVLAVRIHTGRPHQIRIHLASAGCPLWGEPLYATGGLPIARAQDSKLPVPGDCGYWLHAEHLRFVHPERDRCLNLWCPPPPPLA